MGVLLKLVLSILAGLFVALVIIAVLATQFLGFHALGLASDSMSPALRKGDLVVTRPVDINTVQVGDVVAFDEGDQTHITVVHRVAGVINLTVNSTDAKTGLTTSQTNRFLRTKGDANGSLDGEPVGQDRFRGLVFATVPGVGEALGSGTTRGLLVSLATGIAFTWLVYEGMRFRDRRAGVG